MSQTGSPFYRERTEDRVLPSKQAASDRDPEEVTAVPADSPRRDHVSLELYAPVSPYCL